MTVHLRLGDAATTAIAGTASWRSDRELSFVADNYFDPAKTYQVTVAALESTEGRALEGPTTIKFRSRTGGVIAGKSIGHIPRKGVHRVVTVTPSHGAIRPRPRFEVLFDQPITVDVAKSHLHLLDPEGNSVPVSLRHTPADRFQGARVDRRFVIVATPLTALGRGSTYTLEALDNVTSPDARMTRANVRVANTLRMVEATCGWYLQPNDVCELEGSELKTNRREVHFRFNNRIGTPRGRLRSTVRVAPFVRNFVVTREGWRDDGRLVLSGDFQPSVRYRVTVAGLRDELDQPLGKPVTVNVRVAPLGASVTMSEGRIVLDDERTKGFELTSRNVSLAKMRFWKVDEANVEAFQSALDGVEAGRVMDRPPDVELDVPIDAKANTLVNTKVSLQQLDADSSWLTTVAAEELAFAASPVSYPVGSAAARPPIALLRPGDTNSIAVHVHGTPGATLVHVAHLATGEPIAGASIGLASIPGLAVASDASGVALLQDVPALERSRDFLVVKTPSRQLLVPFARVLTSSRELFPELEKAGRSASNPLHERVVMTTDRGIYRPGATVRLKASVYQHKGATLVPLARKGVRMKVLDPRGKEVCRASLTTTDLGGVHSSCKLPTNATVGRHRIELRNPTTNVLYEEASVRVAEFEAPRFKVDVTAKAGATNLEASVVGRYLFGAPMAGAWVQWQIRRQDAPFPAGKLTELGLSFRRRAPRWERERSARKWVRTGESTLDSAGKLAISRNLSLADVRGPQRFSVEADVADKSFRHVAGRTSVVVHPAPTYAGLKVERNWVHVGQTLPVELGVIDTSGRAVTKKRVTARLLRVRWRHVKRRGPGGSLTTEWRQRETEVARCSVQSDVTPVPCNLRVPQTGDFRVVAVVDGRRGGARDIWAWSKDGRRSGGGGPADSSDPSARTAHVSLDRSTYAAGDTAKVVVRNPFPEATVILTVERGGILEHQAKRVTGSAAMFDVAVKAEHAPQVHVTATLLPLRAKGSIRTQFRVGAVTLPVALKDTRLSVKVSPGRKQYAPGDTARVSVRVLDGNKPQANAEVVLAVVDEGVLRLTGFDMPDPVPHLHPPVNLEFSIRDSRGALAQMFERSHVAGDGAGDLTSIPNTRRNFVRTALWKPVLRTNANGEVEVRFKLPDNLTEFRVMALALDDEGKGGASRASFQVTKPVLVEPVVPRFAHVGDNLELAAMVHNNTSKPFDGTLVVGSRTLPLKVKAHGRRRIGLLESPTKTGMQRVRMVARDVNGKVVDSVERSLRVAMPGVDVHPMVSGAFRKEQRVRLRIPDEAQLQSEQHLEIRLVENTSPELSERIAYLLRYPHGCVEQTTSSTLPLLAARKLLPLISADVRPDAFYRTRVQAGLKRLASMQTPSGGLGYWPGATEPHVYGTAYAMRAFILAKAAGMKPPEKVMTGMQEFLRRHVLRDATEVDMRALIALSLVELEALPPGILDTLYAKRAAMSLFGKASLALALDHSDPKPDRVATVLDVLEAGFRQNGSVRTKDGAQIEYGWYGSETRTRAMVTMALTKLRPSSLLVPALVHRLLDAPTSYSTQGTAYSLISLAEHVRAKSDGKTQLMVQLDGVTLEPHRAAAGKPSVYRIPLAELRGEDRELVLRSDGERATGFMVRASYAMPIAKQGDKLVGASASRGPDVYRVFTTPSGGPLDLSDVRAGALVRVALLVRVPRGTDIRRGHLAITDRLPAGFAPVEPDLATVASAPDVTPAHPLYRALRYNRSAASHVELRDDRVHVYFDRLSSYREEVVATYLARATTPGQFALPPASAELMYEPGSTSYSESGLIRIRDHGKPAKPVSP